MATATRSDPFRNFNFVVEIDGVIQAGFTDCSGFGSTTDPTEYNEGGLNSTSRKFAGRTKHNNITLKWGLTDSQELYDWYRDVVNGKIQKRTGSIILWDLEGQERARWNFFKGWPAKWDGPGFTAKSNDVVIETLELANEGIERA